MSVQVLQGACRLILPTLEPGSVDVVITDPPYGETSLDWDVPAVEWLTLIRPLLKPSGSLWCFGSLRMFMQQAGAFREAGWRLAQDVIWEKHNGSGFHADRFRRIHEHAVQFYPVDVAWADVYKSPSRIADPLLSMRSRRALPSHFARREGARSVTPGGSRLLTSAIRTPSCNGYAEHPTQKPVGILIPLIEYSCPPGGVVLDPFAGAGSVGRAAKDVGRDAILIEIDPGYCAIAERRMWQEVLPLADAAS